MSYKTLTSARQLHAAQNIHTVLLCFVMYIPYPSMMTSSNGSIFRVTGHLRVVITRALFQYKDRISRYGLIFNIGSLYWQDDICILRWPPRQRQPLHSPPLGFPVRARNIKTYMVNHVGWCPGDVTSQGISSRATDYVRQIACCFHLVCISSTYLKFWHEWWRHKMETFSA